MLSALLFGPKGLQRDAHIRSLASTLRINLAPEPDICMSRAIPIAQTIMVPLPIRSARQYLVALHELGHCATYNREHTVMLSTLGNTSRTAFQLHQECSAWLWALKHAQPALLSKRAFRHAQLCLWSYIQQPNSEVTQ